MNITGYLHSRYAASHRDFGIPMRMEHCRGWLVRRPITGTDATDLMGCYPLFSCQDWSRLHLDLEQLGAEHVSLALVTDPFGDYDEQYLRRCFPDIVIPFKQHYVIDLEKPSNQVVSSHHRKYARKALRRLTIHIHDNPPAFLDDWMNLHGNLISKHNIRPIGTFSRQAFAEQLATPGMVLFWAAWQGEPVAAIMYFVQGAVAHGHALGYSDAGYEMWAQYALIWSAIEHFTGKVHWLNLMGVPGLRDTGNQGIRSFKEGWTSETRTAWFCGTVCNPGLYRDLVRASGTQQEVYFPAYRASERV